MKDLAIPFSIILLIAYIIVPEPSDFGIYYGAPWNYHLSYMLMHASFMHLVCNVWYLLDFSFRAKSLTPSMWIMAVIIAVLMPTLSDIPVVGISGMLYALSGFLWVYSTDKWYFGMIFIFMTILQLIFNNTAVLFHISCFTAAIVLALLLLPVYSKRR